jgi:hypothetical protein
MRIQQTRRSAPSATEFKDLLSASRSNVADAGSLRPQHVSASQAINARSRARVVDAVVETLRITTNGIVLSVVERRPHKWTKQRQLAGLQRVVDALDIGDADNQVRLAD